MEIEIKLCTVKLVDFQPKYSYPVGGLAEPANNFGKCLHNVVEYHMLY